jgi:uncharacterized membrane protein YgdD (TMEM256/DUF423 family)
MLASAIALALLFLTWTRAASASEAYTMMGSGSTMGIVVALLFSGSLYVIFRAT